MNLLPVHIITGFLGSGKTTFILQLLKEKPEHENWAIVVNEFGKISIDSVTIEEFGVEKGEIYEISGGCICCSAKGNLRENLIKLAQESRFQRIIIEPSGLGGIDLIEELVDEMEFLRLMPSICMVDITVVDEARLQMNWLYRLQIEHADYLVFTKTDLLEEQVLKIQLAKFYQQFPGKKACVGRTFNADLSVNSAAAFEENDRNTPAFYYNPEKENQYVEKSFAVPAAVVFDPEMLFGFLEESKVIIRMKAYVNTDKGWRLMNYSFSGSDYQACSVKQENQFVFIIEKGSKISETSLEARLIDFIEKSKASFIRDEI